MGIFGRIKDLMCANVNDAIDKAENPEKMLKQIIREMEDGIDEAKRETARVLADAKRIEKDVDHKADLMDQWQQRAESALSGGEEDLARKALSLKVQHEAELNELQKRLDDTNDSAAKMKENIETLSGKLNEARARLNSLAARKQAVDNAEKTRKVTDQLEAGGKAFTKFEKLERELEGREAMASATREAEEAEADIEKQFARREKEAMIDNELSALKARIDNNS